MDTMFRLLSESNEVIVKNNKNLAHIKSGVLCWANDINGLRLIKGA